ncbi:MAG: paraquat-inducible protein A [Planctomycetes bacterium]|nr:paraquat-inducible protein A [Planctomycetota bacterium]
MKRGILARRWRGHLVPWLLLLSLALNLVALFVPFLDMRRGLSTTEYSLPRSVWLLWDSGLYVLAVIIVVFSVCFPFFKLGVLIAIVCGWIHPRRRGSWLDMVERLGKWSMLDVFIVCLMIALANDQLLVNATPRIGILCFTFAIQISMVCSAWMEARLARPAPLAAIPRRSLRRLAVVQVLLTALVIAVLLVPFLEIDDWLLVDRPISIVTAIAGLWQTEARTLAVIVASFLAVAPLVSSAVSLTVLHGRWRHRDVNRARRALIVVRHWDMLDVFALALGIFLVEGRTFVKTELAWGAFLLALLLALYWPASAIYQRRIMRA